MTLIDQFESTFKAASRTVFKYQAVPIRRVLVVTDLSEYEGKLFCDKIRNFLAVFGEDTEWQTVCKDTCQGVQRLLKSIEERRPDLICTYRHLHSGAWDWPYGLGEHLDVLTQVTTTPVLVMPRPEDSGALDQVHDTDAVMAMTSQLSGDDHLVNYALSFCQSDGALWLTHVEDSATFERYIDAIGKIPSIDTLAAREAILQQLLKDAHNYIASCRQALSDARVGVRVEESISLGDHLADCRKLIDGHDIDLLVLNTKDEDQLAMHGLAYPLAVELRSLPLLML